MEILGSPFGILTDGKIWRIYSRELSSDTYRRNYQFNLGNLMRHVLGGLDQGDVAYKIYIENAKYFFHFFNKKAIHAEEGERRFLDDLLEYSKKYASTVEEDLKHRFVKAIAYACNGYKDSMKGDKSAPDLDTIRNIAESQLFNILFIRYCESRNILPLRDSADYKAISLSNLIDRLDNGAYDPERRDADNNLYLGKFLKRDLKGDVYNPKGTELYDRLMDLTKVIQDGDKNKRYDSIEIRGFRQSIFVGDEWGFAKRYKLSNDTMVRILFELGYNRSQRPGKKYQQIPYNFFSPRQLGSIYESFLDFRLERAEKDMAFIKRQWVPANLASEKVAKLDVPKVQAGDLFFTPDNHDRKMTGSYYTPDVLVQKLVGDTVGPLVRGKRSTDIAKIRLCDATMGSGHFLSAALAYLAKAYLAAVEAETNDDLAITLQDAKRTLLHTSIFGFDINPRAVKLARMSLWLESASAGEVLEPLDEQLFCQDSLIPRTSGYPKGFKKDGAQFDCVIGNPPWDKLKFDEEEFLKKFTSDLSSKKVSKTKKQEVFRKLLGNAEIRSKFEVAKSQVEAKIESIRTCYYEFQEDSGEQKARFIDFNLYKLAVERFVKLLAPNGRIGLIVPTGLFGDLGCSGIRKFIFSSSRVEQIVGFNKSSKLFDISQPFCYFVAQAGAGTEEFKYIDNLFAKDVESIDAKVSAAPSIGISLIKRLSPDTFSIPNIESETCMRIFNKSYSVVDKFGHQDLDISRELDQTDDAKYLSASKSAYAVVKGDEIDHFEFRGNVKQYLNSDGVIRFKKRIGSPRKKLALRAISGTNDPRRLVCAILPSGCLTVNSIRVSACELDDDGLYFYQAIVNSRVVEFVFRTISKNNNVNKFAVSMLPIPVFDANNSKMAAIALASKKLCASKISESGYEKLDQMVMELFQISSADQKVLVASLSPAIPRVNRRATS